MRYLVLFSAVFLTILALAEGYPNPLGCTGDCFTHDPSVIKRADGKYFRFSTLGLISIRTASSLGGPWTAVGSVINGASVINLDGNDQLWVSVNQTGICDERY